MFIVVVIRKKRQNTFEDDDDCCHTIIMSNMKEDRGNALQLHLRGVFTIIIWRE